MTADQIRAAIAALQALLNEPPMPTLGPDDVYLQVTGKVYPKPHPEKGEGFVGYVQRVGAATGRSTSAAGSLFDSGAHLFTQGPYNPDGSNWPEAADRFFNGRAYMTDAERTAFDAAQAEWTRWGGALQGR
jgi:hypothetical protein